MLKSRSLLLFGLCISSTGLHVGMQTNARRRRLRNSIQDTVTNKCEDYIIRHNMDLQGAKQNELFNHNFDSSEYANRPIYLYGSNDPSGKFIVRGTGTNPEDIISKIYIYDYTSVAGLVGVLLTKIGFYKNSWPSLK
jgi:hypothetical protein